MLSRVRTLTFPVFLYIVLCFPNRLAYQNKEHLFAGFLGLFSVNKYIYSVEKSKNTFIYLFQTEEQKWCQKHSSSATNALFHLSEIWTHVQ